ncbi:MAG: hypothetical protein QNJ29_09605 [Rhizobiaceae bacterium]|nr:hypothetical protein [Rhizobiaceae bacterium]
MNGDVILQLIEEAVLAPSVHNTQPAKWKIDRNKVHLYEDLSKRLIAGDPTGRDAAMSLGAALEGFSMAATSRNLRAEPFKYEENSSPPNLRLERSFELHETLQGMDPDPLHQYAKTRKSWRGSFATPTEQDRISAHKLAGDDCAVISETAQVGRLAVLVDEASLSFMRDKAFRDELVSWMRLSKNDQRWSSDGLNADAMQLNAIEALTVKLVMGPLFTTIDRLTLASKLLAENNKTKTATAIVILHRPKGETPFDSGRAFYRLWLRIEQLGFSAGVIAALADSQMAAAQLANLIGMPNNRKIVSAFRIGRIGSSNKIKRARRNVTHYLVN